MKILIALTYYRPHVSGLTIYVERLATGLAARGHDVTVLTSQHDPALPRTAEVDGVRVVRVPVAVRIGKGVLMPSFGRVATRLLREHDAVSIHLPQFEAASLALRARLLGRPATLTYHCDLQLPPGLFNRVVDRVVASSNFVAALSADAIVAYTEDYAESVPLLRRFRRKISVVPPPVVMPPVEDEAVATFRAAHGSSPSASGPTIGMAARFATEKGIDVLLDALPLVEERHPGVRVLYAGPYESIQGEERYRERLLPRIEALGSRWRFLGQLDPVREMPAFLAGLDCLVVPSVNSTESFGLVQVEAMLCGTPVVASALPGVREVIRQTGMGEVVAVRDPAALAGAICRVLERPDAYRRPREEIARIYDLDATIASYEKLLGRQPRAEAPKERRELGEASAPRSGPARVSYGIVTRAPSGAVGRARTSTRLAPVLEAGFTALGAPLFGKVVPVARGPAAGLRLRGERRSLVWISGSAERAVQEALLSHLRRGDTFVDAGASIGFFSLLGARVVGTEGRVVAFEPQPAAARSIRENAALNGFANVTVVDAALSFHTGDALLEGVGEATAHVTARSTDRAVRVPCVTLDGFLAEHADLRPALVKIDVEGHETGVMDGMVATLGSQRPALIVECHAAAAGIVARLERAGYHVSVLGSSASAAAAGHGSHLLAVATTRGPEHV